jgi:hypothetical protein
MVDEKLNGEGRLSSRISQFWMIRLQVSYGFWIRINVVLGGQKHKFFLYP